MRAVFLLLLVGASWGLSIGSFNIQSFGPSKLSNSAVMGYIIRILSRYDIVFVQEIRDATHQVIPGVLERLRRNNQAWNVVASDRLGRSTYKEQYAYFYRSDVITAIMSHQYDDGPDDGSDMFSREPFGVLFYSATTTVETFGVIGVHVAPEDAVREINHLRAVYEDARMAWDTPNIILLGDFNADCSYVSTAAWDNIGIKHDRNFLWLIDDETDTTVSNTNCAYDRIVATGADLIESAHSAGVYMFDRDFRITDQSVAASVSDHYPVEVQLT